MNSVILVKQPYSLSLLRHSSINSFLDKNHALAQVPIEPDDESLPKFLPAGFDELDVDVAVDVGFIWKLHSPMNSTATFVPALPVFVDCNLLRSLLQPPSNEPVKEGVLCIPGVILFYSSPSFSSFAVSETLESINGGRHVRRFLHIEVSQRSTVVFFSVHYHHPVRCLPTCRSNSSASVSVGLLLPPDKICTLFSAAGIIYIFTRSMRCHFLY